MLREVPTGILAGVSGERSLRDGVRNADIDKRDYLEHLIG
jgi:hypothetical protein